MAKKKESIETGIQHFMKIKGITSKELAEAVNLSESTVSAWIKGTKTPYAAVETLLCSTLGCTIEEMKATYPIDSNKPVEARESPAQPSTKNVLPPSEEKAPVKEEPATIKSVPAEKKVSTKKKSPTKDPNVAAKPIVIVDAMSGKEKASAPVQPKDKTPSKPEKTKKPIVKEHEEPNPLAVYKALDVDNILKGKKVPSGEQLELWVQNYTANLRRQAFQLEEAMLALTAKANASNSLDAKYSKIEANPKLKELVDIGLKLSDEALDAALSMMRLVAKK